MLYGSFAEICFDPRISGNSLGGHLQRQFDLIALFPGAVDDGVTLLGLVFKEFSIDFECVVFAPSRDAQSQLFFEFVRSFVNGYFDVALPGIEKRRVRNKIPNPKVMFILDCKNLVLLFLVGEGSAFDVCHIVLYAGHHLGVEIRIAAQKTG